MSAATSRIDLSGDPPPPCSPSSLLTAASPAPQERIPLRLLPPLAAASQAPQVRTPFARSQIRESHWHGRLAAAAVPLPAVGATAPTRWSPLPARRFHPLPAGHSPPHLPRCLLPPATGQAKDSRTRRRTENGISKQQVSKHNCLVGAKEVPSGKQHEGPFELTS
ncbi:uncharacterized protein LOC120644689 isoform X2 [Panicum virgatum]|uniref:uncharacterized protein LOC120644689 isoform X2 n=1 Tax=Panicum virgatum TaxID=38727 RepID=UPI0019D55B70|nr:uncharacterized protein LOC120644689 isoform X2 [Panicum virgatum]